MRKGFTLIEILIVVAIIAILASVVLVGLGPTQQSGRDARRLSDLYQIQNALGLYNNKCGGFPGSVNCAGNPHSARWPAANTANTYYGGLATDLVGMVGLGVNSMPQDPTTGKSYFYAPGSASGLSTSYVIGAQLENTNNAAFTNYNPPSVPGNGDSASMNGCGAPVYCLTL